MRTAWDCAALAKAWNDELRKFLGEGPSKVELKEVAGAILATPPNATPRESHERWLKAKLESGWAYGPVQDAEKKTHPCMVEYDELPEEQKIKDELFLLAVRLFRIVERDEK